MSTDAPDHGPVVEYIYVPYKEGTVVNTLGDLTFMFFSGWFDCFLQRVTPLDEDFSDGWECYEIYADGTARRRGGAEV